MVNLKELMMIQELHRQGLSVSAISERTGHDRKTVRKYIRQGLVTPVRQVVQRVVTTICRMAPGSRPLRARAATSR